MVIKETSAFTRHIQSLLSPESYKDLQAALILNPGMGTIIRDCGGIRKLRWQAKGHGKRGGIRVIYYHLDKEGQLYMLLAYAKNERGDLTHEQKKELKKLVQEEL